MRSFFWIFIPMMVFVMGIIFGWQWSISWGLKEKLPRAVNMNFKRFRAFMIFPLVYLILYMLLIVGFFSTMTNLASTPNSDLALQSMMPYIFGMILIIPLHLFAMFCMFHNIYFCAKLLKSIELGREAELGEYIGYFFLFWFNFVGFWIIQPSVNRISSADWTPPPPHPGYDFANTPNPTTSPPQQKEIVPAGEKLKKKDNIAFEHDDDFEGLF